MSITLAEILRIKAEKGYSVSKLSEYSGVPVETLRKILAGNTTTRWKLIWRHWKTYCFRMHVRII